MCFECRAGDLGDRQALAVGPPSRGCRAWHFRAAGLGLLLLLDNRDDVMRKARAARAAIRDRGTRLLDATAPAFDRWETARGNGKRHSYAVARDRFANAGRDWSRFYVSPTLDRFRARPLSALPIGHVLIANSLGMMCSRTSEIASSKPIFGPMKRMSDAPCSPALFSGPCPTRGRCSGISRSLTSRRSR